MSERHQKKAAIINTDTFRLDQLQCRAKNKRMNIENLRVGTGCLPAIYELMLQVIECPVAILSQKVFDELEAKLYAARTDFLIDTVSGKRYTICDFSDVCALLLIKDYPWLAYDPQLIGEVVFQYSLVYCKYF